MEDYIKCELIGGVSPGHLNTFSNFFYFGYTLRTYQYLPCLVAIVDCNHVYRVVQNIRAYYTLLILLTAPKL